MATLGDLLRGAKLESGLGLGDLTVLSPQNDPYRIDTPTFHEAGRGSAISSPGSTYAASTYAGSTTPFSVARRSRTAGRTSTRPRRGSGSRTWRPRRRGGSATSRSRGSRTGATRRHHQAGVQDEPATPVLRVIPELTCPRT